MSARRLFSKKINLGPNGKLIAIATFIIFNISVSVLYYIRFGKVMGIPIFLILIFSLMFFQVAKNKAK